MVDDSFHDAWKGMNKQNLQHRKTVLSRTGRRVIRQLISSCYHCQTDHTLQKQLKLSWGCLDETPTKDIVDDTIDNALNGMKKTEIVSLVAKYFPVKRVLLTEKLKEKCDDLVRNYMYIRTVIRIKEWSMHISHAFCVRHTLWCFCFRLKHYRME